MKLNALGVTSSDIKKTMHFYSLIGFKFPSLKQNEQHIETVPKSGEPKLMIDSKEIIKGIIGADPIPGNHSSFAIEYDSPQEVNKVCEEIKKQGYKVMKEPWDAFWGQRYAVVQDPDGYMVDLYAALK